MKASEQEKRALLDAGNAMRVQQNQLYRAEEQTLSVREATDALLQQGKHQDAVLAELMRQMDLLEALAERDDLTEENLSVLEPINTNAFYVDAPDIPLTNTVALDDSMSWEQYMESVERYAHLESLDLSSDPYMSLMSKRQQAEFADMVRTDYYEKSAQCDAVDYALSALCGVIAGLVDAVFVGMPSESKLVGWTDKQVDECIIKFAKSKFAGTKGWNPRSENENSVGHAIKYLESIYKVNYDAATINQLGDAAKQVFDLSPGNHHIKSLAHSPDFVGLIFSLIDQFTATAHFVDRGRVITYDTARQELIGDSFIAKLYAGFCNWFGHCISDIAGSSNRMSGSGRGMGLPIPGYELFQFLNFGSIDRKTFAELSVEVFEKGYDARFGVAMAIPVVLNDLLVRLCFALKRRFYHHLPMKECIPFDANPIQRQPELRRMLLVAHGTMCVIDAGDAVLESGGVAVTGALRLNVFAYIRLSQLGFSEIRAIYRQNHIDIRKLTKDTDSEWKRLYEETRNWTMYQLN